MAKAHTLHEGRITVPFPPVGGRRITADSLGRPVLGPPWCFKHIYFRKNAFFLCITHIVIRNLYKYNPY